MAIWKTIQFLRSCFLWESTVRSMIAFVVSNYFFSYWFRQIYIRSWVLQSRLWPSIWSHLVWGVAVVIYNCSCPQGPVVQNRSEGKPHRAIQLFLHSQQRLSSLLESLWWLLVEEACTSKHKIKGLLAALYKRGWLCWTICWTIDLPKKVGVSYEDQCIYIYLDLLAQNPSKYRSPNLANSSDKGVRRPCNLCLACSERGAKALEGQIVRSNPFLMGQDEIIGFFHLIFNVSKTAFYSALTMLATPLWFWV